ncbi:MAG: cysteine desulfurase family protein [Planctomycetota bacterium]
MQAIYLDANATTRPSPEASDAVDEAHRRFWANPSSVHRFGQEVRQRLELARRQVAELLRAKPSGIVFTSGGTESNNLALRGVLDRAAPGEPATLITSRVEHSAVREPAEAAEPRGVRVVWVPVDADGVVDAAAVAEAARLAPGTTLASVQWANNETGTVQPVAQIAEALRSVNEDRRECRLPAAVFHTDATQAAGKLPIDVKSAGVDLLTIAAHKFHGPKGVGALYVRRGVRLVRQNIGGPQEIDRRGGTEHVPGILGMGVAAEQAAAWVADADGIASIRALRDRFECNVQRAVPEALINAEHATYGRLWNTANLAFPKLEAEAILLGLSERGVFASAGAACSSGSLEPSPVLRAMGMDEPRAHGSVRFSLSRTTMREEIEAAVPVVAQVVGRLSQTMPVGPPR